MNVLYDFDLTIILPLYQCMNKFKSILPTNIKYYERNGIEVLIVTDNTCESQLAEFISEYPFVNWKVIIINAWVNPSKAINVGIRHATKRYIMVVSPLTEFRKDMIGIMRDGLKYYPQHYAIGQHCSMYKVGSTSCIMVEKIHFEQVGGYRENIENEELGLQRRLDFIGIRRLFIGDAILTYNEDEFVFDDRNLSEVFLPIVKKTNDNNWGKAPHRVVFDWQNHSCAQELCSRYLLDFKSFDISSESIFKKSYSLIALLPTFNESEMISDCLQSIEKHCDGIILLDDNSTDNTYQMAQSDKLLLKVKKERTEFNDKQNRNILLNLASFLKAEWFIFIDADERFDERFVNLNDCMKSPVDVVGVWIANLWENKQIYRTDMNDTNPHSQNGLWFRWRMFRNKGRMQITSPLNLHFVTVPYISRECISKTLLLHLGYLDENKRMRKYKFYQLEDRTKILNYESILHEECKLEKVSNITSLAFKKQR